MNATWFSELKAISLQEAVAWAGLSLGRNGIRPCPACEATRRSRKDPRPPVWVRADRLGWRCYACGVTGDILSLLAYAATGSLRPSNWTQVREWALRQGVLVGSCVALHDARSESRSPSRSSTPWPPPLEPVGIELRNWGQALWRSCVPLDSGGKLWLKSRGIGEWAEPLLRTATGSTCRFAGYGGISGWVAVPWCSTEKEVLGARFRRPWNGQGKHRLSPRRPEGIDHLYLRPGLLRRPGAKGAGPLVIVEGASDGLCALEMWPDASVWMLGGAAWRSSWVQLVPGTAEIVVALDSDPAGRRGTSHVIDDLFRLLGPVEFRCRVRLPTLAPGEDLCDVMERLGQERGAREMVS